MILRKLTGPAVTAAVLCMTLAAAHAFDESKYPNLKGQWVRARFPGVTGQPSYDPTYTCISPGMPRVMNPYGAMEIVMTPETTHILLEHIHDSRRIFTDGRGWPKDYLEPTFVGYSLGTWIDTDGDGRYDTLEVETRYLRGPRSFDATGIPLHPDNQTVIKERIHWNKNDPDTLTDEITTIDNVLTRPWTVTKKYVREQVERPDWYEDVCTEGNGHVSIAGQNYFLSGDGMLMPAKKGQAPPDLRYFKQTQK